MFVWPEGKDQILRFESQEGDESDDSLYDILTGRTPVPPLGDSARRRSYGSEDGGEHVDFGATESVQRPDSTGSFDDTFREKRDARSRGRSVLDESGLDEMF